MKQLLSTRLTLTPIGPQHASFMRQLVNSEGWLTYIGDRNVHSDADAIAYVERIMQTPDLHYWVAQLSGTDQYIGVFSFLKRNYLEHWDLGFALLPRYTQQGYAFEGAQTVLECVQQDHSVILATTLVGNRKSIALLEKLGFQFECELENQGDLLSIYQYHAASDGKVGH